MIFALKKRPTTTELPLGLTYESSSVSLCSIDHNFLASLDCINTPIKLMWRRRSCSSSFSSRRLRGVRSGILSDLPLSQGCSRADAEPWAHRRRHQPEAGGGYESDHRTDSGDECDLPDQLI